MNDNPLFSKTGLLGMAVIVSALGYFVDIYDIVIFGIVRTPSLQGIGVPPDQFFSTGVLLINAQMAGMLAGGVLWGVMGDRRGRLSILFGSILLYSVANIANAFVTSVPQYVVLRFLAGVGLAGEIGGAITLISEIMPANKRGYATTIISTLGYTGAIVAGLVAKVFDWRMAYIAGGVMGLALLFLRAKTFESGMFEMVKARKDVSRGNPLMLLWPPRRLKTYLACILMGAPIYYIVLVFAYFAPELAKELGASGPVSSATALMCMYSGLVVGGTASGLTSEALKNRRKAVAIFLTIGVAACAAFLFVPGGSAPFVYYLVDGLIGVAGGYWTLFLIVSAEQFGTNIRASASTTIANVVRASTIVITSAYGWMKGFMTLQHSALFLGVICFGLALPSLLFLKETHGRDLDYTE